MHIFKNGFVWVKTGCLGLGVGITFAVSSPHAVAQSTSSSGSGPAVMVVIDGSGSMWGKTRAGEVKRTLVRNGFSAAFADYTKRIGKARSRRLSVGYMGFGPRCSSAKLLAQPEAFDASQADIAALAVRNPQGRGPVALSIQRSFDALADTPSSERHIVVVADGADNCGQDACALAADLKARDKGLRIHVAGLGLGERDVARVQCLATQTGGTFANVSDEAGFAVAITKVFAGVSLGRSSVNLSDIPDDAEDASGPSRVRLAALLGGSESAIASQATWRIKAIKGNGQAIVSRKALPTLRLPAGQYDVEASVGNATAKRRITIAAQGLTRANVPVAAGVVRLAIRPDKGRPPLRDVNIDLTALDAKVKPLEDGPQGLGVMNADGTRILHLSKGRYRIRVDRGLATEDLTFDVKPGADVTKEIILDVGQLRVAAVAAAGLDPLQGVEFRLLETDPDAQGGFREVARSASSNPVFEVPAGFYRIEARAGGATAQDRVKISVGAADRHTVLLASGLLQFAIADTALKLTPDIDVRYRVEATGRSIAETPFTPMETIDGAAKLRLPAGRYRVHAMIGSANAAAVTDVEIVPGGTHVARLNPQAGAVRFNLITPDIDTPLRDVFWQILSEDGVAVHSTGRSEPKLVLAQGRYDVKAIWKGRTFSRKLLVDAGDSQLFALTVQ